MSQTQGLRQTDPYRVLQLHPNAPRALIDEAYWLLSQRPRANERPSDPRSGDGKALDAAYAAVIEIDRAPKRMSAAAGGLDDAKPDLYQLLCVDPSADRQIIDLAHLLLSRAAQSEQAGTHQRDLDDAYCTLSSPHLRAQYDAVRAPAHARGGAAALHGAAQRTDPEPRHGVRRSLLHFVGSASLRERTEARLLTLRRDRTDG